ncbi:hypothetical protein ACFQ7F_11260 [Streptomyces sp. NPDC056486]|uniref:hypothetical protein n=1 Tax=Streptomyces sp. NPDC056486 TaxID=3345835 RepID=UPI003683D926
MSTNHSTNHSTNRSTNRSRDGRAMVQDVEGYLLLSATRDEGRAAAIRVTARLDWLTGSQREELERYLETECLALARVSWQRTADRAEELGRTYEGRYQALRRRLVAWCLAGCAALAVTDLLLLAAVYTG